jgi:hypothetical protein
MVRVWRATCARSACKKSPNSDSTRFRGHCAHCFYVLFPDAPASRAMPPQVAAQVAWMRAVHGMSAAEDLSLAWQYEAKVCDALTGATTGADDGEKLRRADVFVRLGRHELMLEFVPHQHTDRTLRDESGRQTQIEERRMADGAADSVTCLRTNTSPFRDEGGKHRDPSVRERVVAIEVAVRDWAARVDAGRATGCALEWLFYDRCPWNKGRVCVKHAPKEAMYDHETAGAWSPGVTVAVAETASLVRGGSGGVVLVPHALVGSRTARSPSDVTLAALIARGIPTAAVSTDASRSATVFPPGTAWRDVRALVLFPATRQERLRASSFDPSAAAARAVLAVARRDSCALRWFPKRHRRWEHAVALSGDPRCVDTLETAARIAAARKLVSGSDTVTVLVPDRSSIVSSLRWDLRKHSCVSSVRTCYVPSFAYMRTDVSSYAPWIDAAYHANLLRAALNALDTAAGPTGRRQSQLTEIERRKRVEDELMVVQEEEREEELAKSRELLAIQEAERRRYKRRNRQKCVTRKLRRTRSAGAEGTQPWLRRRTRNT